MGILSGNPKDEPMHYGEISEVWAFSAKAKGMLSAYEALQYHAGDKDLKGMLEKLIDQSRKEIMECDELLTANGITPAPGYPERPEVKLEDIPAGARFTDPEIAAKIAADVSMGLVGCSTIMGTCIREDIGALFAKYHTVLLSFNTQILRMNKDKGWLIPPPLHVKRPELVEV
ncbi:DUF3231 family protein [Xylanibacillus composti]|uniref:Membrane protein n=1 Tax=Xylanibacillus composti TaxID=1572762 RepID=A0A8J4M4G5_9BACL|nr:DUF3231 family protein [Xylanibacillus composti]MDT9726438.1 DUF3231 family protein [Xylanibacillus composti]GIQ71105.1 membrane protein [Xylanibacillus composti]